MRVGFIGAGNMATAILSGLVKKINSKDIYVYDIDEAKVESMKGYGVNAVFDNDYVMTNSDVVILAIKPYQYQEYIKNNKHLLADKIVVSIAAGISDVFLSETLGHSNYVRVMPNTPALVGSGVTGVCENPYIADSDFDKICDIFRSVGRVELVPKKGFDAIIPVTGSSPAYIFMFIDELIKVGVSEGMSYETAKTLACEALIGSAKLFLEEDEKAGVMVDRVCSKGGTTIEGVISLRQDGFSDVMSKALNKCLDRAKEMTRENNESILK